MQDISQLIWKNVETALNTKKNELRTKERQALFIQAQRNWILIKIIDGFQLYFSDSWYCVSFPILLS